MIYQGEGRIIKGVGGLYTVSLAQAGDHPLVGQTVFARGRGALHRKGALLIGDRVRIDYTDASFSEVDGHILPKADGTDIAVSEILPRRNALIRPPMANLEVLFVTLAAASPDPLLRTVDKLIAIAEHNAIEPVLVITKAELDTKVAEELATLYRACGFPVFLLGQGIEDDASALASYIKTELSGRIAAFSGASGVGKSTLINRLFPSLSLETGALSARIERGKNTTRHVELFPLDDTPDCGYLADTPGFTMLDFARFDFFTVEQLPDTFREFRPHIGTCRFKKCTHTKETGCAILEAVKDGSIPKSRHDSFLELYTTLKAKHKWD